MSDRLMERTNGPTNERKNERKVDQPNVYKKGRMDGRTKLLLAEFMHEGIQIMNVNTNNECE